jgi:hypothetical protein
MGLIFLFMIIFYKHAVPTGLKQAKLHRACPALRGVKCL